MGTWRENSIPRAPRNMKRIISFTGLHEGNLRRLVREGSANMFIGVGTSTDIFSYLTGFVVPLSCHNTLRDISLWARATWAQKF